MDELNQFQQVLREATNDLLCETHPTLCALRDTNYTRLEDLVLTQILHDNNDEISQANLASILAFLEQELP